MYPSSKAPLPAVHSVLRAAIAIGSLAVGCGFGCAGAQGKPTSATEVRPREPRLRSESTFASEHDPRTAGPLKGSWIDLGRSRAYRSLPAGVTAPMPGIVVLHTARGLSRGIQLWTDRLAEEGYAAIAIDLYKGRVGENREHARALRDEANGRPDENMAIIRDAYEHLASDPNVRATRRALIGWSYGAGWATVMASRLPGLSAVIAHYGAADLGPDAVARMQAPFLLICGDRDEEREGMAALEGALRSARKSVEVLWTQANHGFADPSHAGYDGLVAARSYAEVRRFLAATLH